MVEVIGVVGVVLCIVAYFLIQSKKLSSDHLLYILLNLIGALGIMISLCYQWNLPAFLMELSWLLISLYGLCLYIIEARSKRED